MFINKQFWKLTESCNDKTIRIDVSSPYQYRTREKNAVIHALASNLEWYSADNDHWNIQTDSCGVLIELVSRDKVELERALSIVRATLAKEHA